METSYSAEQEAFRDSLRRYLADKCDQSFARKQWNEKIPHTHELWNNLVEMGVTALLVPETNGGLGMGMTDMGVVMEELGRRVNPAPVIASAVVATSIATLSSKNDHIKNKKLLESLVDGSIVGTLAFEEEGCSFLNWKTPLTVVHNNKLNGKKINVADALAADVIFVTAKDGVYFVDKKSAGLRIDHVDMIDGSRRIATVDFDNVSAIKVSELAVLDPVIDRLIVSVSADAIGAAEMALYLTLQYAKERNQFGVPIGSFQAVQHMLAEMFQQVEMAKAGLHYALWCLDDADATEAHRAAVMIKAFICDKFPKLGADAVQIFGGAGFTWEYDIQLYYKRLLSAELLYGNSEVWFEELARITID